MEGWGGDAHGIDDLSFGKPDPMQKLRESTSAIDIMAAKASPSLQKVVHRPPRKPLKVWLKDARDKFRIRHLFLYRWLCVVLIVVTIFVAIVGFASGLAWFAAHIWPLIPGWAVFLAAFLGSTAFLAAISMCD